MTFDRFTSAQAASITIAKPLTCGTNSLTCGAITTGGKLVVNYTNPTIEIFSPTSIGTIQLHFSNNNNQKNCFFQFVGNINGYGRGDLALVHGIGQNSATVAADSRLYFPALHPRVGIYNTNPAYTLDLTGDFRASGQSHLMGNVGIGVLATVNFQLDLSTDNARKLTTTTWLTASDQRVKTNIVTANYDTLYNIVKNLDLKYFTWNFQNETDNNNVEDKNCIGWIAQEVKEIFPKAVKITDETEKYGISDFHTLNADQLYKAMYGCCKKLIEKVEQLTEKVESLQNQINLR
jgi:hypothetical protein